MWCENVSYIHVAHDMLKWQDFMNTEINFRVAYMQALSSVAGQKCPTSRS
jgi:hypothetical protein